METTDTPVAIVADPAALVAQIAALDAIEADCRKQLVQPGITPGRIADLARSSEAARAAASALFNFCSIAAIYLEEKPVRVSLDAYNAGKYGEVLARV